MSNSAGRAHIDSPLRTLILKVGGIVIAALVMLTMLYLRAEAVSPQAHINYTEQLRTLREADAKVDAEVLAARMELARNYDALTAYFKNVIAAGNHLLEPPEFLLENDRLRVEKKAAELATDLQQKTRLIDRFKSQNAILHNSLAYFQESAGNLGSNTGNPLAHHLESYVMQTLFFIHNPERELGDELHRIRQQIDALSAAPQERKLINNLLLHGRVIEEYLPKIDELIRSMLRLDNVSRQDELFLIYSAGYESARRVAQQYRNLFYLLAVVLTAYLANTFIRLEQTRRSLVKAHREVTERYEAQLRAEKLLKLHDTAFYSAHEGITLTDATGTIMEVNPAFTRITGYERDEVIGRNPKVLKSGKHDDAFYSAMWSSINTTGNWRGEIWNRNKYGEIYPEILSITTVSDAQGNVTNFVAVFADISRLKEQEVQLQQMAYYDALTDLPNRVLLTDRMSQSISQTLRNDTLMAVCYLDLDSFKPINDTYGHEAGDRLLIEISNRLKGSMRGGDTVARLGGDEFAILLLGLNKAEECKYTIKRIMRDITQPVEICGESVTVTASIGVTIYPHDHCDAETLLRHADQAMYQAKQKGKNRYHLFDYKEDSLARSQHERISRIETALHNNELVLYYQPKVDLRKGKVIGLEALIRWQHPEDGLIPPLDFLPAIEGNELIIRVGQWVIDTALTQMTVWQASGLDISVSVNIASRQLQHPDFVADLKHTLGRHPAIRASQLELEVLETAALEDIVSVSKIIEDCRTLGISFALDDFGTGYSSLTYLKRLPASTLKIDKSFVREILMDPENLAIVQGIIGLTKAFQRQVIAEGVETPEHGRMLLQLGCNYAQGYGIAKPMPADDVPAWISAWRPDPAWKTVSDLYWEDADYPILVAEVEHQRWVSMLIYAVNNNQPVPHKQFADHYQCHFGKWYYGSARQRYGNIDSFRQLELPHRRIHEIAKEMDYYLRDGKIERAKSLIPELLKQRDEVLRELQKLSQAVALTNLSTTAKQDNRALV